MWLSSGFCPSCFTKNICIPVYFCAYLRMEYIPRLNITLTHLIGIFFVEYILDTIDTLLFELPRGDCNGVF